MRYFCLTTLVLFRFLNLPAVQATAVSPTTQTTATSPTTQTTATSPTCLQPRSTTDPTADKIQSVITSDDSITKACTPEQRVDVSTGSYYALNKAYYFNVSLDVSGSLVNSPSLSDCSDSFKLLLSSCISSQDFWGGWIVSSGVNYTSKPKTCPFFRSIKN